MGGERLTAADLGAAGIAGDRCFALRDTRREEIQSCKTRPGLLRCTAARDDATGGVTVTFPDGTAVPSTDRARMDARLSELVGHASTLEGLRPADEVDFYRRYPPGWQTTLTDTFAREPGEPLPGFLKDVSASAAAFVTNPGSFFLVTPFHFLTTASLAHLEGLNPSGDWDVRRFRPNVVVDTGADGRGLVEQDWVGRRLAFGTAEVACPMATPRCGAVIRPQAELAEDRSVLRTVVREADQNVGVYGEIVKPGRVLLGDAVGRVREP